MGSRHRIARPLVAAVLMAGVGLTGCGNDDAPQGETETPPSSTPLSGPDESTATPSASPT